MSYTALYRKYRPAKFSDVKGQDAVVTTLKNQIKTSTMSHAYLFCGTRGTGKTTAAKIFARAVNCEAPVDGSPCGCCPSCLAAAAGSPVNIIEMDAASNNGVDDVRQIREEVSYPPAQGKYKVYIIDEAHMLSGQAFNALLKTLEEPPAYVIFILATTEAGKIPVTILSRCQRYDFRRISAQTIAERMNELLREEQAEADEDAVRYIARAADGSMRDALSLLDQCLSFYIGERLTLGHVLDILGTADTQLYDRLLRAIIADDAAGAVGIFDEALMKGRDTARFVSDFLWHLRNLLLVKSSPDMRDRMDLSSEDLEILLEEADMVKDEELMRCIRVFSELSGSLRGASQKRVMAEIAVIRLCRPEMEVKTDALLARISKLERKIEEGRIEVKTSPVREEVPAKTEDVPKEKLYPEAVPENIREVVKNRDAVADLFSRPLKKYLQEAVFSLGDNGELIIAFDDRTLYDLAKKREEEIGSKISGYIEKEIRVKAAFNETTRSGEMEYTDLSEFIDFELTREDDE